MIAVIPSEAAQPRSRGIPVFLFEAARKPVNPLFH
jgi:hypothetical protein